MATLIASLQAETVDWVGTSMGGIIGMFLAATPGSPIRKLVLNDVGSRIPKVALERIGKYVGADLAFDSIDALEEAMRSASPFGKLTADQWRHLSLHVARHDDDGKWRFKYDPGIAKNYHAAPIAEIDLTRYWTGFHGPALVIRGAQSDLLPAEVVDEMCKRPHTEPLVIPDTGHAPMLMDDHQAGAVRHFLLT
jgi:pimeloyl-ACP methyl ester carboxylesterase